MGAASTPLGAREFADLLAGARGRMWLIAAAVLGDRTEAEDVVQEAAVIALGKLTEFARGTSFESWMGQIVRNVARNASRKRSRRQALKVAAAAGTEQMGARPATITESAFDTVLLEGLGTLEETARVCLLLRVVGELPYRSIAAIVQVPEGTAMSHVHRARERLRRWMTEHGTGSHREREGGSA